MEEAEKFSVSAPRIYDEFRDLLAARSIGIRVWICRKEGKRKALGISGGQSGTVKKEKDKERLEVQIASRKT